ncbi:hypothetical protein [Acetobacterium wieringae]|uniref:hypothetical protein n=1 Tax=Acetobacterium wieringae TaxID=52694 RepID=UPI002B203729|nr:hypothetical protein [Acetobacterium wieringae]MEA4805106.1 hypothetical protein [Acetobacterium wieringae]
MQGDVKSKPILFNTAMVQAILNGRKTVTRRVVKPIKRKGTFIEEDFAGRPCEWVYTGIDSKRLVKMCEPPYQVGDVLWVREAFNTDWCDHVIYKSDGGSAIEAGYSREPKWRPSIHMPKKAARIFLKVTDVRVERLQDITLEGCISEGISDDYNATSEKHHEALAERAYPVIFSELWDSTIKKKDLDEFGWDASPWVWVVEFERCENAI